MKKRPQKSRAIVISPPHKLDTVPKSVREFSTGAPEIQRARQTRLEAWPVILSLLLETADSDAVRSIVGLAGIKADWSISKAESYSHKTRKRAYRPLIEAAYNCLIPSDQGAVLAVIAAELARSYPRSLETLMNALAKVGWTLKVTPKPTAQADQGNQIMRRDEDLQKLLLLQVRDGKTPPGLERFPEAQQVYNAALLINEGLVEGRALKGQQGTYESAVMTDLTSAGHDFLEGTSEPNDGSFGEQALPVELAASVGRFRIEHPFSAKAAFIMMRFGTTPAHNQIVKTIRGELSRHGIAALRADDKEYHDELLSNILTYAHGCGFGIAVFERIEQEEFNPNVALEVGYMMALKKPVLLLKDKTLRSLNTDLIGRLYKTFDPQNITGTIPGQIKKWLEDKDLLD